MKKVKNEIDDVIGDNYQRELTKKEHDLVRENRRVLYEARSKQDKINDILTGFRFSLKNYVEKEDLKEIILLGDFLNLLLQQINVKKGVFAEFIEISPRNINKYFNGERKFSIEHALKLEKLFNINAEVILEVQLKNELIEMKRTVKAEFDNYNLSDLLAV